MAKIVNLRRARKARRRDEARAEADANAIRHGESKSERRITEEEARRRERSLDQHRLDDADPEE